MPLMLDSPCWPLQIHRLPPPLCSGTQVAIFFVHDNPDINKLSYPLASGWSGQLGGTCRRSERGKKSGWRGIRLVPSCQGTLWQ